MAFSYFGKKDYNKSIEISAQALKYKSDLLGPLIVQIGNAQDELGSPEKAVETYKAGIKLSPSFALLHYNMAISLQRLKKPAEARTAVKKAVSLDPNHPGSHRLLSALFYQEGYKTPALLAAYRFLVLEPSTDRAGLTLEIVKRVMQGGVNPGKNPNEINIFVDMAPAKKDEGDFSSLDLFLGLARAANYTEKNRNKSQAELEIDNLSSLIAMLDESKADRSSFTWKYYVPYFIELKKRGFVEPFWYYTNQRSGIPGVSEWLNTHVGKLSQFLVWSKSYNWSVVS
jgi:tetratricopeptide (TPR) repeat protein